MGCEPSLEVSDNNYTETEAEFQLNYRQFILNDRGQIFQFYHLSSIVSKSNSSIIRKAIKRTTQQEKICKIVPLANKKSVFKLSEMETLKNLNHPNIVHAQEFFIETDFFYIIMEEIPGKKILDEIKSQNTIDFYNIVSIMIQILSAIEYCHKKMIVHRIINPENILLMWNKQPIVKIIDFSETTQKDCPKPIPVPSFKKNFLSDVECQEAYQIEKVDIRDCGLIFYYILTGQKSCKGHNFEKSQKQYLKNLSQSLDNMQIEDCKLKESLYELIQGMLHLEKKERPTAQQCLRHSFFKNFQLYQKEPLYQGKKQFQQELIKNMLKFQVEDKLKSLICMYFSLNLTTCIEKSAYLNEFYNLDKNKDGQIQYQQLVEGLQNTFNFTQSDAEQEATKIFKNLDKNNSGSLDFNEFVMGSMDISKLISEQTLKKIFKELDINGDKNIEKGEINNLIFGIEGYDMLEGKKSLSFDDFKEMMADLTKLKENQLSKKTKKEIQIFQQDIQ